MTTARAPSKRVTMSIAPALAAFALVCGAAPAAAAPQAPTAAGQEGPASVSGRLSVVGGAADLSKLVVRINGAPVQVTRDGALAASLPAGDYYQLSVAGPGVFASVHSFGHAEVARGDGRILLPPVEIVAKAPGRVELFFGGDSMIGRRYVEPLAGERVLVRDGTRAADMARLLEPMRPYFAGADLASLNLETVLATSEPADVPGKSVVFHTHPEAARVLKAGGIDYVTLGNNHVYDHLDGGLKTTIAALDAAGLAWSGAGPNEAAALKAARLTVGGNRYAMLGFVGWKGRVEPNQVAEPGKGGAAFGSDENIRESVRRERAAGLAPIVQYHGSTEYSDRPTEISERRMKLAIDSGAALVVSHHPHVPQGLELYKGRLIAYSMGNFLFDQDFPETHGSIALKVWMDGDALFRAEVVPIQILDYRPVPAVGGFRQAILRRIAALSAERGTRLALSGGHGVVQPSGPGGADRIASAEVEDRDILWRGDFENARYGDALDRSWAVEGAVIRFDGNARSGRSAMHVAAAPGGTAVTVAPKTFLRPTSASRYSLTGWARAGDALTIEVGVQAHPKGQSRAKALKGAPTVRLTPAQLDAKGDWRQFRFDFAPPVDAGGAPLPMRPILRLTGTAEAALDDVALIALPESAEIAAAGEPQ